MGINPYNSTNWYPEDLPKPDVKPSNKYATWIWLGLVTLIVAALLTYIVHRRVGCLLTDCRSNPVAPSLSWDEQFAIGQAAALKADKDAILESVYAQPFASWPQNWTVSDTLKLSLTYVLPSGDRLYVDYDDATQDGRPQVNRLTVHEASDSFTQQYYQSLSTSQKRINDLSAVKISPREAELITWQKATEEAKNDGVEIAPILVLEFGNTGPDEPPRWQIAYWPVPVGELPTSDDIPIAHLFRDNSSQFTVNAINGEIIQIDLLPGQRPTSP